MTSCYIHIIYIYIKCICYAYTLHVYNMGICYMHIIFVYIICFYTCVHYSVEKLSWLLFLLYFSAEDRREYLEALLRECKKEEAAPVLNDDALNDLIARRYGLCLWIWGACILTYVNVMIYNTEEMMSSLRERTKSIIYRLLT